MNKVVEILMKRDDLTQEEAQAIFNDVQAQLEEAAETRSYALCEEIMYDELGLEMDYLLDIL